jgi:HlyD family secretion protein
MRRWFRWLLILGVLAALVVAGSIPAMSWWKERLATRYLTAPVSRGRVETVVNSTGTIKPVLSVSVGAFTSGPIAEVKVNFNTKVRAGEPLAAVGASTLGLLPFGQGPLVAASVLTPERGRKGDLLARIDPKLFQAAVDRDQAALETQRADLARIEALLRQAENNEKRANKLQAINKDYISDADMDQFCFARQSLAAQRKLALAMIAQAEANLKNSGANLGYTEIRAPADGIVIERKVDPGQTMAAAFQTPEMFIIGVKMDEYMHVFASVDEADIGLIHAAKEQGRVVKFTVDAYPGHIFEGTIAQIRMNSTTTQNVVTYPVVIKAPNRDLKLMPGMTANISFEVEAKDNILRVPAAALRFTPLPAQVRPEDRHYLEPLAVSLPEGSRRSAAEKAEQARSRQRRTVWVRDGELLRAVPVTLGLIENHYAEVLTGDLHEGQDVVTGVENTAAAR